MPEKKIEKTEVKKADEKVEKSAEDLAKDIAKEITKAMTSANEMNAKQGEKLEKINATEVKTVDKEFKVGVRKSGEALKMKKSDIEISAKWFKAFLNKKDDSYAFNLAQKEMQKHSQGLDYSEKLEPLNETTSAEGGLFVPPVLANTIVPLLEDMAVIRPRATVVDISGLKTNTYRLPNIASNPIATWSGVEQSGADKGTSSMTFGNNELTPYTLSTIVFMTKQILADSPINIVSLAIKSIAEAMAKAEDKAFASGSGSGQPTGINQYTYPTVSAGGAINYDAMITAYWRLPQAYRSKAYWLANGRTIAEMQKLKDTTGAYLINPVIANQEGLPTIFGRPVLEQNDIETSSIFFLAMDNYWIADNGGVEMKLAEEATVGSVNLFMRNMIALRVEKRTDGEMATVRAGVEITETGVS